MPDTGSVTIPLFHCVFNEGGSITHWSTTYERKIYDQLQHLYLVCLAEGGAISRRVVGAFMVKTSRHHNDADFAEVLSLATKKMESLSLVMGRDTRLLPARIGIQGEPPEEKEFLRIAMEQYLKFSSGGSA